MKIVCFLKRKAGTSRPQFREYYENNHAPLIERLLPSYSEYRRSYLADVQDYATGHLDNRVEKDPGFDVLTEMTFDDQSGYDSLIAALSDPRIGAVVRDDEEQFIDRSAISVYIVE